MEKELSMGKAIVETYNYEAYPLAIMASRGDEYLVWLLNNYIQLNCHKKIGEDGDLFLAFYDDQGFKSPYLKTQLISHDALTKLNIDMRMFIKNSINEGYYLHFLVDEYYISHRYYFQKMHLIHDLLICGYTGEDELIVWGYDEKAKFSKTKLAFSNFEKGFLANDLDKDKNDWADKIRLMKYKSNVKYRFNLDLLIGLLEDYINSKNRFEKYSRYRNELENTCYGLEIYQKVLDYIDSFEKRKLEYFDNRIFKIILEHKFIMQKRLEYLQKYIDCKGLQEEYKQVMEKANNCHLLAIMFNMKHKKEVLEQIKQNIRFIRNEDRRIIQNLIEKITRINNNL